ncbi:hypothetical protein B0H11DRAFT_351605 [Mycena galericulata]|nr:hypothetical protein B0H11DRAFT_351605 [Mycena galericulata]
MSLLCLPVELVSKILKGMCLEDLLSVTRTAAYLRSVCLADRQIWRLALDSQMLPLPAGKTLDSIEMPLILCCAARAVAISAAFERPTVIPLHSLELTNPLPNWGVVCGILPGGHSFLIGGSTLGLFSVHGTYVHQFEAKEGTIPASFAWESSDNGACIFLAVIWAVRRGRNTPRDSSLSVYRLEYDHASAYRTAPDISVVYSCNISELLAPVQVEMRNLCVLIWDTPQYEEEESNIIFLVDVTLRKRMRLFPAANDSFYIVYANLHPDLSMVVVVTRTEMDDDGDSNRAVEVIEFDFCQIASNTNWETVHFNSQRIAELGKFPYSEKQSRTLCGTLRVQDDSILIDDVHHSRRIRRRRWCIPLSLSPSDPVSPEEQYDCGDPSSCFRVIEKIPSGRMAFAFRQTTGEASPWNLVQLIRNGARELHVSSDFLRSYMALDDIHGILIFLCRGRILIARI